MRARIKLSESIYKKELTTKEKERAQQQQHKN